MSFDLEVFARGQCGALVDSIMEADRRWFAQHPRRAYHLRRPFFGEFPGRPDYVVIHKAMDEVRIRIPAHTDVALVDTEAVAAALYQRLSALLDSTENPA